MDEASIFGVPPFLVLSSGTIRAVPKTITSCTRAAHVSGRLEQVSGRLEQTDPPAQ